MRSQFIGVTKLVLTCFKGIKVTFEFVL